MLNIPDTVKTLFKQDGVQKNFRVHFPNGEMNDLTNDNVVKESVHFSESLSSRAVLSFGLTEASVIEFETVGVSNMYGMTIECACEIDLSSLTAAQITAIGEGTWDGEYVSSASSDLGYAFFRVSYGTFRVESCPRNHQAMTHRKVQAYSLTRQVNESPIEKAKLDVLASFSQKYTPDVEKLLYASAGWATPGFLSNLTKTTHKTWSTWATSLGYSQRPYSYLSKPWDVSIQGESFQINVDLTNLVGGEVVFGTDTGESAPNELYSLELAGTSNIETAMQAVSDAIDQLNRTHVTKRKAEILTAVKNYLCVNLRGAPNPKNDNNKRYFSIDGDISVFYPYFGDSKTTLTILKSATVTITERAIMQGSTVDYSKTANVTLYSSAPTVYKYTGANSGIRPVILPTGDYKPSGLKRRYLYNDSYKLMDFVDGYLELKAYFGCTRRNGSFAMMRLSNASPISVIPGEYSSMWWDEYDVLPIGTIKYTYLDSDGNENTVFYDFGSSGSLYDMTDNQLIKQLSNASEDNINHLLDENFIPNLAPLTFTPIDMNMKGLPYIEAGDYLAVTTEDDEVAYSYALQHEIDGIQVLDSTVQSSGGDIIESKGSV